MTGAIGARGVSDRALRSARAAACRVSDQQLTGRDDSHVREFAAGQALHPRVASAFFALRDDAAAAGFDLAVASSYRSFDRQALIWNGKLRGERSVHDDTGQSLNLAAMTDVDSIAAVLRFSALPGASRHHWGTDLDVYDAAALPAGESVRLVPAEVCPGGRFDDMHCWLDERMRLGESRGFFRPYAQDHGGVAPERWHLSYAPLSWHLESRLTPELLREAWSAVDIAAVAVLEKNLPLLLSRYVAVPAGWAGSHSKT